MTNHRTTPTLIANAIKAFEDAGLTVGAVEVRSGGFVRIIPDGKVEVGQKDSSTCDDIFEMRSG